MSILTPTAYIPVPISEPPTEDGRYHVISNRGATYSARRIGEFWYDWHGENPIRLAVEKDCTHWLRPVDLSRMLEDAYSAGYSKAWAMHNATLGDSWDSYDKLPNKETYINSVLNPPK